MTRRSELMLEDLRECEHVLETPIMDRSGVDILYWRCRCGAVKHPPEESIESAHALVMSAPNEGTPGAEP